MTSQERERYSRQILFPGIGEAGQERLLASHVLILGCGALGTFQAQALARAGVGRLTIVDRDYIEPSNLQRQWLYDEQDALEALPKAVAAERALRRVNSSVKATGIVADVTPGNIEDLAEGAGLLLDGSDNFELRYLVNDYALREGLPWIYGGAVGSYGIETAFLPGRTCFRCLYPHPPVGVQPTCDTAGVLGPVTAAVASLQVADALQILTGRALEPRITTLDVWNGGMRQIPQPEPDPMCPACQGRQFEYLDGRRRTPVSLCGRNAVQIHERTRPLDLEQLKTALTPLGEVRANDFGLRFVTPPYELTVFPDGRAIIKGTTDIALARSLYSRYVGV